VARPWKKIASVPTPEGALELHQRGEKDFLIFINGRVLMSSAAHRSEDALAKLACAELGGRPRPRVLLSGLGMGFTLRAALDELADDAHVTVAEVNPVVVDWCKGPLASLITGAASDPRVTLEIVDVAVRIGAVARHAEAPRFDAIILDMYEGPPSHVRPSDPLYGSRALLHTKKALTKNGVFAVWGEGPSAGFERSLREAGFSFRGARAGRGARIHHVYIARNALSSADPARASRPSPRARSPRAGGQPSRG
jgi:spermidine synthase